MERDLNASGWLLLAERVMLELGKHIGRQHAHDIISEWAMEALSHATPSLTYSKRVQRSPRIFHKTALMNYRTRISILASRLNTLTACLRDGR